MLLASLRANSGVIICRLFQLEVDRQLQSEKARNDELQVRLQALEARIQALE